MKTTLDIDEAVLREAESQARRQGKSFGALVEEALRAVIRPSASPMPQANTPNGSGEGLEQDDPFFAALDEVRAAGRASIGGRKIDLQ